MSDVTTASEISGADDGSDTGSRPSLRARSVSVGLEKYDAESDDGVDLFGEDDDKPVRGIKRRRAAQHVKRPATKHLPPKRPKPKKRTWSDPNSPTLSTDGSSDSDNDPKDKLPQGIRLRRDRFDRRRMHFQDAGLLLPPTYEGIDFSGDGKLEHLIEKPNLPAAKPIRPYKDILLEKSLGVIPASIAQWLRDYQVEGAQFLHQKFVFQLGGILGDDMGLGKTIQVISFLTAAFGKTGDQRDIKRMRKVRKSDTKAFYPRILIVCPGTLIANWKAELDRWGWWHVDVYHGSGKETAIDAAKAGRTEIMITTYTTYREWKAVVNEVTWDAVIADECHVIKGRSSTTTKAMNEINALCRIGLTGNAIQNTYDELWTLLNWTSPGELGSAREWWQMITRPLRSGQSHGATLGELGTARRTAEALTQKVLPRFFLRRMKTLIARQLPKKTDRVVFCALTETQADVYERFLDSEKIEAIKTATDICDCGSGKKRGWCCFKFLGNGHKWQEYVFPCIASLQKMTNHLASLIPQDTDSREKQEKDVLLLEDAFPDDWRTIMETRRSILNYANPDYCGKWKVLKKLLRFWHDNGDKVLIFSHSVRLLRMLQVLFKNTSYNVSYLDGSMNLEGRANEVDIFNADPDQFVFLISTKAGGVGLNIVSANKVVIFDPNWNPAFDLQAQDRAYRIGQTRDVEVFRLVSSGTIEEIVYARQIYKQQQANIGYTASKERRYFQGVQEDKTQKGEIFGLKNLFAYQGENIVLREIVNKTNVAESKAGVAIADVDLSQLDIDDHLFSSQADDEDGAMSQIAKMVTKGETEFGPGAANNIIRGLKSDPVQAILAEAGVEYTHENSEVIGSSKVEAKISRKAEAAGDDLSQGKKHAFAETQERAGDGAQRSDTDDQDDGLSRIDWKFNPPEDAKRRQFCTMAKTFGFQTAEEFALIVEGWTQAQRRNCLDRFYTKRREKLGLGTSRQRQGTADTETKGET